MYLSVAVTKTTTSHPFLHTNSSSSTPSSVTKVCLLFLSTDRLHPTTPRVLMVCPPPPQQNGPIQMVQKLVQNNFKKKMSKNCFPI